MCECMFFILNTASLIATLTDANAFFHETRAIETSPIDKQTPSILEETYWTTFNLIHFV